MSDIVQYLASMQERQMRAINDIMSPLRNYKPDTIAQSFHERDLKSGAQQQLLDIYRKFQAENRVALAMNNPEALGKLEDLKRQILSFNARSAESGTKLQGIQDLARTNPTARALVGQYSQVFGEFENPTSIVLDYDANNNTIYALENGQRVGLTSSSYHNSVDPDQVQENFNPLELGATNAINTNKFISLRTQKINSTGAWTREDHINAVDETVRENLKYQSTDMSYSYNAYQLDWMGRQANAPKDQEEQVEFLKNHQEEILSEFIGGIANNTYQAAQSLYGSATSGVPTKYKYDATAWRLMNSTRADVNESPQYEFTINFDGVNASSPAAENAFLIWGAKQTKKGVAGINIPTATSYWDGFKTSENSRLNFGTKPSLNTSFPVALLNGVRTNEQIQGNLTQILPPVFAFVPAGNQPKEYAFTDETMDTPTELKLQEGMPFNEQVGLKYLKDKIKKFAKSGALDAATLERVKNANSMKDVFEIYMQALEIQPKDFYSKDLSSVFGIKPVQYAVIESGKDYYHVPLYGSNLSSFNSVIDMEFSNPAAGLLFNDYKQLYPATKEYVDIFTTQMGAVDPTTGIGSLPIQRTSMPSNTQKTPKK